MKWVFAVCIALTLVSSCSALPDDLAKTFDDLYFWGLTAYTDERWSACAAFFKRALSDYKYWQDVNFFCHKRCSMEVRLSENTNSASLNDDSLWILSTLGRFAQHSLCSVRCKQEQFGGRPEKAINPDVLTAFENFVPYSYLQYCSWKLKDLENAVSAAYTFLIRHPNNTMMLENLNHFNKNPNFSPKFYKDLEEKEYQTLYFEGVAAYESEPSEFEVVIEKMEASLKAYLEEMEKCRVLCYGPHSTSSQISVLMDESDLFHNVSKNYLSLLKCRGNCSARLGHIRGHYVPDFLASHFHYLQIAYWKVRHVRKACEAVATYLLFEPDDENMLFNRGYYQDQYQLSESEFKPREDIAHLKAIDDAERAIYAFFVSALTKQEGGEYPPEGAEDYTDSKLKDLTDGLEGAPPLPDSEAPKGPEAPHEKDTSKKIWSPSSETLNSIKRDHCVVVSQKEGDLNGHFRFVAENILSSDDCQNLLTLAKYAKSGDGYDGNKSPHTSHEAFRGLRVMNAVKLALSGDVPVKTAKLFLDKSELVRELMEQYFNLSSHLYLDYTHLVCRDSDNESAREDLSHPIHGDNCVFKNGECVKTEPAFTWRDYSAIVYLHDTFEGGEFIFTDNNYNVQAMILPSCGKVVGFSGDSLHGVKAVKKGTRCALAMWMTLDPKYAEKDREDAKELLFALERTSKEESF